MKEFKDYYNILRVTPRATDVEIKKSYRKLALLYHPDRNPSGEQFMDYFMEIQEAYEILSNPGSRRKYDSEFIKKYGSLSSKHIKTAENLINEFTHLSLLSKEYFKGGIPKQIITDYFIFLISPPHPNILKNHLNIQEWENLANNIFKVLPLFHYLDLMDYEEEIQILIHNNKKEEYLEVINKIRKRHTLQRVKPFTIILISLIIIFLMYKYA